MQFFPDMAIGPFKISLNLFLEEGTDKRETWCE